MAVGLGGASKPTLAPLLARVRKCWLRQTPKYDRAFVEVQISWGEILVCHYSKRKYEFGGTERKRETFPCQVHPNVAENGDELVSTTPRRERKWESGEWVPSFPRCEGCYWRNLFLFLNIQTIEAKTPWLWKERDWKRSWWEHQRALKRNDSCWLYSGLQEEIHLWTTAKTSPKYLPDPVCGHPNAINIKSTPPTTLWLAYCTSSWV